ncbi:TetR/AcrR family transcriptional regulator [Bacillota bacterium]
MTKEKPLTTRQKNALITKQSIYDAAIDLFLKKGYENVKIEEITQAANVAKGTFYIYFDSKKNLLYHSFVQFDSMYLDVYNQISHINSFEEQLVAFLELSYKNLNNMGKELARAIYHNSVLEDNPIQYNNERTLFQIILKIVRLGFQTGELNPKYPENYYLNLIKTQIAGIDYSWIVSADEIDFSTLTKSNIYALTKGILNL